MVPDLSIGITVDCMHAITVREPGGPDALVWTEVPDPVPGPGEVLIDVAASAVNRADLLQRQGFYPPPPGASDIKFEDPRLDRFMAAPPRKGAWVKMAAKAGQVILFESWLRHEVAPNPVEAERISISFNYNWF